MLTEPLSRLSWHLSASPGQPLPPALVASLARYLDDCERYGHTTAEKIERRRVMRENLRALADALAPGACLWQQAGAIAEALQGFACAAYARIQSGHREPRTDIEQGLCVALRSGAPRSQRRIYEAIADGPR